MIFNYGIVAIMKTILRAILELRISYAIKYGYRPIDINDGNCGDFAAAISDMGFGGDIWGDNFDKEFWTDAIDCCENFLEYFSAGHCFIWYGGRFYDSECPQGCDYLDNLPFYRRSIAYAKKYFSKLEE